MNLYRRDERSGQYWPAALTDILEAARQFCAHETRFWRLADDAARMQFVQLCCFHVREPQLLILFLDAEHRVIGLERYYCVPRTAIRFLDSQLVRRVVVLNAKGVILARGSGSEPPQVTDEDELWHRHAVRLLGHLNTPLIQYFVVGGEPQECCSYRPGGHGARLQR